MVVSSSLCRCSVRRGCCSVWSEHCRNVELEPSGHGDRVGAEVSRRQGSEEGVQVWPAHREVDGKNLSGDLVELGLNESDEGGRHVLLGPCLSLLV